MEIKGKIYCFFEQSGTFKNEFRKLGYEAEDYDIQNEYGETDHICDLFAEIEKGYDGKPSIFDKITPDDLILAFFPCIYFSQQNTTFFDGTNNNWAKKSRREIANCIIERDREREKFYVLLLKLMNMCEVNELRIVVENPYSPLHYLINNFMYKPTIIDKNRRLRGDYYEKPTMYFFLNCEPTNGRSWTKPKEVRTVNNSGGHNGSLCDKVRSEISPDYARNFICDYIIGKVQQHTLPTLF
ncbi:MAG: hypothetical protein II554_05090 [Bacteroidales bacterium]|nr:hypothetical protein [Bacteroidales bacterium]